MSLRTIFREIRRTLTSWEEIDSLPQWCKYPILDYYQYKTFKGKHYIYKVWNTAEVQGGSYRFYRKKKIY